MVQRFKAVLIQDEQTSGCGIRLPFDPKRLREAWDALSYTRRKEMAHSIEGAKRDETRQRRLARTLEELGSV